MATKTDTQSMKDLADECFVAMGKDDSARDTLHRAAVSLTSASATVERLRTRAEELEKENQTLRQQKNAIRHDMQPGATDRQLSYIDSLMRQSGFDPRCVDQEAARVLKAPENVLGAPVREWARTLDYPSISGAISRLREHRDSL